ncbi:hypothetical protein [Microlunatus antarcticus]|uniref:Uncharacterized protein n=1 Tax=Microlunatus antarcticus TaxID=53388 RepID=A0A7W5JSA3_9ACTN|nr:hypothetical protein [Microlunatus antarcticus]MBB3325404.1 hypothetical protein [Microlunatus antarcticus]
MTTQLLVTSTAAEGLLATAAAEAGLLDVADRLVVVPGTDDVERAAAAVGDDAVELVVGTSSLPVGRALSRHLGDAPVTLLAVGATAYGPTYGALQGRLAKRVRQVLHLDLVPELEPLLLDERDVPTRPVPLAGVRALAAALPSPGPVPDPTTLVLGRSAAWGGGLDRDDRTDLLVAMVQRCAEAGHSRIVLLLDEDTPDRVRRPLDKAAAAARADLTLVTDDGPVEAWLALDGVGLVVGSATEDLLVARSVFGRRVAQLDSEVVLKHLDAADDPRRVAATLVAATVPDLRTWTAHPGGQDPVPLDLTGLLGTVAYTMQPGLLAARRAASIGFLEVHPKIRQRFLRKRWLSELRLPGGKRKVHKTLG